MGSLSRTKFESLLSRAALLSAQAAKLNKKPERQAKLTFLHAALTAQVAAWDVYIKAIAAEYFSVTSRPADPAYSAVHGMLQLRMAAAAKKLNTPDSERCREFLISHIGFDPWPSWVNVRFGSSIFSASMLTRSRLDDIFKVRHSFAHGLTMPAYAWNMDLSGTATLSCQLLSDTRRFFLDLCRNTDAAIAIHIVAQHGLAKPW